jgi:hypothetical protein
MISSGHAHLSTKCLSGLLNTTVIGGYNHLSRITLKGLLPHTLDHRQTGNIP